MTHSNQKNLCSACGTSPVNHTTTFVGSILDRTIGTMGDVCFGWTSRIISTDDRIYTLVERGLMRLLETVGLLKYSTDIEKAASGRSKLIWDEAVHRGIEMEQLVMLGKPLEQYRAKINGQWNYFQSIPVPPKMVRHEYGWLDDKFILKKKLTKAGIPAPRVRKIPFWVTPAGARIHLDKPVIIKPQSGSRGRHTTTNIQNDTDFKKAVTIGRQITPWLVEEEHLYGSVYRATVVGGKLVGFFRADPPEVTGDGSKTIRELVEEKNTHRSERLSDIVINDDVVSFIAREGYAPTSVLPRGLTIPLSAKTGRMYGGYTKEMFDLVHPRMHTIFEKAATVVGAPVAGFDLIIQDPTLDPDTQRWGIIECNSLPFIDLHYFALEGTPRNIAEHVWDLWNIKN